MKVKILETEDIREAKKWSEMSDDERKNTLSEKYHHLVTDNMIFIKPPEFSEVWMAFNIEEVQVLEEERKCS